MTEPDMWLSQKGTSELISIILQTKGMNKTRGDAYRAMSELNINHHTRINTRMMTEP